MPTKQSYRAPGWRQRKPAEVVVRLWAMLALLLLPAAQAEPEPPASTAAAAMRLLKKHCFSCHNEEKEKGGLVMTSRDALLKGSDNGAALVVGRPEESALIATLGDEADPHMPPKKQLSPRQIEVLNHWVKNGAEWDASALVDQPAGPRAVSLAALPPSYQPVLAMALSPSAGQLAIGCGNEVVVYDVAEKTLSNPRRSHAHPDSVQSIAWSADGKQLVTGAFRRIVVWDVDSLSPKQQITDGLTDRITALRFIGDQPQVVVADGRTGAEGTLRIVDVTTGSITSSWSAHRDTIFDLAISADGKMLATAAGDKFVKVWNLATQQETGRFEGHTAQVLTLAFNADATQLVTGGADQQLKVWDVQSREQIIRVGNHTAAINGVVWSSAGGAIIAVTDAGGVLRYSDLKPHTGAQSSESANERKLESADEVLYCVAATADGTRIFAGAYDGRVFGWNKDGKLETKLEVHGGKGAATVAGTQPVSAK